MAVVTTAMRELGHHVVGAHERVLIMTYNVLAQTYVKSSWFPYCDPLALRWKNRSKKLAEVFQALPVKPHVVCLQEVDNFHEFWATTMKSMGYEGLYVQKQGRKKEGVAIFWYDAKLDLVKHETIGLDIPLGDESDCSEDLLTRTARGSVGLIAEFAIRSAAEKKANEKKKRPRFLVATTHLFWDPSQEDVKLLQTRRIVRHLKGYNEKKQLPLVFAGDFNSLPDSEVYRFITATHTYKSAYSEYDQSETPPREPAFTNVNGLRNDEQNRPIPGFIGTLDYIFYQSPRLQPVALLEIMSREEATKEQSLPSTFSPSDHLPMICEFALKLQDWSPKRRLRTSCRHECRQMQLQIHAGPRRAIDSPAERRAPLCIRDIRIYMGGTTSSFTRGSALLASPREKAALEKIVSELPVPREDAAYAALLNAPVALTHLSQRDVEFVSQEYGTTLAQNNLRSGNFRVLVRFAIHALPLCCRMEKMTPDELASYATPTANALHGGDGSENKSRSPLETHVHQAVNALFLVRNFTMRFVEKQDECSLLAHFNQVTLPDFNTTVSPRVRGNAAIRVGDPTASASARPLPLARQTSAMTDDLAFKFLDTLLTVLMEFRPSPKTYELFAEVLNTLLVLLSPVAYPRDHSKDANDLSLHNPFLHMLMTAASPGGKKSFWATGLVQALLWNYMEPLASPPHAKDNLTVVHTMRNAEAMSLIKISENVEAASIDEADQFSYLTLEGIGTLASTIFKFPLNFYHYFVSSDGLSYPLADRSALILLVLLQSCRDSGAPTNPFRDMLCSMTTTEKKPISDAQDVVRVVDPKQDKGKLMEISFSKLFASAGHKAPYESSHLILYTLLYTNPMMHDAAISQCDVDHVMLPLLETLYHAKSVDPSRIYMLVIALLTYTQDPAFVRNAHTKIMVRNVPWYSERYILDVSLGSLMMVIFTRLIYRNITHFQDSFIHLNAFAALSNLARAAENLHGYAAQSIVGLIEMLAKMETKFSARMTRENQLENDELVQKRSAYVEFIRLLLGVVSSCLKPSLLPRNPQLIYSLLYRAETFTALQRHPEISHQVNNYSIWTTLARFQTLVETKTTTDETLDVDTVLELITAECVGLLASSAAASNATARAGRGAAHAQAAHASADDEASYRYEEETDPEQFFVPYIWKLIFEQTPEFCWKADKITLFTPGAAKATVTVTQ